LSIRLSPDGQYYWDGQQWISTLSSDGRHRWNGTAWIPTGSIYAPAGTYQQSNRTRRAPTSWTKPLQFAVAGWYAISAVYALTVPFWMSGRMADVMNASMQRQQQRYPSATPPPPELVSAMTSIMTGAVWIGALVGLAICIVAIVGALNRWTWLYYAVMVLLGFVVLLLVVRPLVRRIIAPEEAAPQVSIAAAIAGGDVKGAIAAGATAEDIKGVPSATAKMIDIAQVQGQVHAQSVHKVGELAERNPNETVAIVRQWLSETPA